MKYLGVIVFLTTLTLVRTQDTYIGIPSYQERKYNNLRVIPRLSYTHLLQQDIVSYEFTGMEYQNNIVTKCGTCIKSKSGEIQLL